MAAAPYSAYVGIDISKATLDICLLTVDSSTNVRIENSIAALAELFKAQEPFSNIKFKKTLFCFEALGAYQNHLVTYLLKKKAYFTIQSALHIRLSMGLVRGKE